MNLIIMSEIYLSDQTRWDPIIFLKIKNLMLVGGRKVEARQATVIVEGLLVNFEFPQPR